MYLLNTLPFLYLLVSFFTSSFQLDPIDSPNQTSSANSNPLTSNPLKAYIVSIRTQNYVADPGDNLFCGGVIINAFWILTAAHCVTVSAIGTEFRVVNRFHIVVVVSINERYDKVPEKNIYDVSEIKVHEDYKRNWDNDVALLKLVKGLHTVVWQTFHRGVRLPGEPLKVNTTCQTLTWGRHRRTGSRVLETLSPAIARFSVDYDEHPGLEFPIRHLPYTMCKKVYHNTKRDAPHHLCMKKLEQRGTHSPEDTGNPLFCDNVLYGISASYNRNYIHTKPMIYTNIYIYVSWILDVLSNLGCSHLGGSQQMLLLIIHFIDWGQFSNWIRKQSRQPEFRVATPNNKTTICRRQFVFYRFISPSIDDQVKKLCTDCQRLQE